jgi:hypothetical protein
MIHAIFCNPPLALARLGASPRPMAAYGWEAAVNPRTSGETVIVPRWTLEVLADGSVQPVRPETITFKDGGQIRPVCPFIELWAWTGPAGAAEAQWQAVPLTQVLLQAEGLTSAAIEITVTARNLKAARRRNDPRLAFGTFPPLRFLANDHSAKPLVGVSPPGANPAMIPAGRSIPLGSVRMIRPRPQPTSAAGNDWVSEVDISILRLRVTPPPGVCYGPNVPDATMTESDTPGLVHDRAVPRSRAFLSPAAGWHNVERDALGRVFPADTVDEMSGSARSLGVIDDTSEMLIEVRLNAAAGAVREARTTVMVAPPDFAPDRRPFFSLADEINDLAVDPQARSDLLDAEQLEHWVADLFERVFETADLFNLDRNRNGFAATLGANRLAAAIPGDMVAAPPRAMGGRDALRNRDFALPAPVAQVPLPLTRHARERHRALSDVQALRNFVAANPTRLPRLVRGPFESEAAAPGNVEGLRNTTMRMPPFMAQSTPATPLTLTAWQYALLMRWHDFALSGGAVGALPPGALSEDAETARADILSQPETRDLAW